MIQLNLIKILWVSVKCQLVGATKNYRDVFFYCTKGEKPLWATLNFFIDCVCTWCLCQNILVAILSLDIFKYPTTRWQQEGQWINRFSKQNNNFACAILCCFCTTIMWKCLISCFMYNVNKKWRNFISLCEF